MGQRLSRWAFIFFFMYLLLIGGSPYYFTVFPIRVLHHVVMTAVLSVWLIARLLRHRGLPSTPLNPLIVALVVLWGIKTVLSLDPRVSAEVIWFPITHAVIFMIMAAQIQSGRVRLLIETQFLIAALLVIIGLFQLGSWWFGWGIVPDTDVGWGPLVAQGILPTEFPGLYLPLGVTTWLAGYAAPLAVFSLGWAFMQRARGIRIAFFVLAGLLSLIIWLTGARGGLVSLAVGSAVLSLLLFVRSDRFRTLSRQQKIGFVAIPVGLLAVAGALVILISQLPRSGSSDQLRLGLWRGAVSIFAENPIHGVGAGMFGRAYREARTDSYVDDRLGTAHNAVLNTLAETGLAGGLLLLALTGIVIRVWWRSWRAATGGHAVRLAAAFAALCGLAVHSQFDLFTSTPNVLLLLFFVALIVVPVEPEKSRTALNRAAGVAALFIVMGYGVAFWGWDSAHAAFNRSLRSEIAPTEALVDARAAQAQDPGLSLYRLQIAYLTSRAVDANPALLADAISQLETALDSEPTWDTGMLLLADLYERQGRPGDALRILWEAQGVNQRNLAEFNWARLAEQYSLAPSEDIVGSYASALTTSIRFLPLSPWWTQTPARTASLEELESAYNPAVLYRLWRAHDPERLGALLDELPDDAYGSWVRGEAALDAGDAEAAVTHFSDALSRGYGPIGDAYASLGRAWYMLDPAAPQTRLYLDAAVAAGTSLESPNVLRAELETSPERVFALRAQALPPRIIEQNFEGVLYLGRVANFELPASMRPPGPGRRAMEPWYAIAQDYEVSGQTDAAANAYRAIRTYAPDETEAAEALTRLEGERP